MCEIKVSYKDEETDDGESVMVEAKYFDDLSQPEHLRYS